ncbi:Myc-type, basic helix-loop-helix (bHLH) domain containing protein [Trema orientale]|uniref:Myc-type, basic helix-loop-helix (BHLH) domain containing protein n=1 Tax=Trema orientale TaxID=63057 RepID=A0A2P5EYK7_TREOI|nr:Myc-type, basic helix-loop-helix (bHLH) domain containing protein [Trema orientale]
MAKNERLDCDNLAVTGGTSFSQLLFADDDVLGLDVNQIFRCNNINNNNNNNESLFSAEKTPRMLCFEKFPNRGERAFSESTQKSGVTCSDSSSSASSSNNTSVSTMSKSNINRNGSDQESVQCTSTVTTTTCTVPNRRTSSKKIKTENPTTNVPAKRKEKLGERITALQHLVSPFGKTDTASVLHEAMGYIRFLQEQVQVLCSPYLQRLPSSLPDKEGGGGGENGVVGGEGRSKDLRSRGLCLIPVECTVHVANTNGADLWSPAMASNVSSSTKQ